LFWSLLSTGSVPGALAISHTHSQGGLCHEPSSNSFIQNSVTCATDSLLSTRPDAAHCRQLAHSQKLDPLNGLAHIRLGPGERLIRVRHKDLEAFLDRRHHESCTKQ